MGAAVVAQFRTAWQDEGTSRTRPAKVYGLDQSGSVRFLRVQLADGLPFRFKAGQYARLTLGERLPRPYSIASTPEDDALEFHIRHSPETRGAAEYAMNHLAEGDRIGIDGPYGSAWLRKAHKGPILAIAGGTGLSAAYSIVLTALRRGVAQPILLYAGIRRNNDHYLKDPLNALALVYPNFKIAVSVSDEAPDEAFRAGTVTAVVRTDFTDLRGFHVYAAGPPAMTRSAIETILELGAERESVFTDYEWPLNDRKLRSPMNGPRPVLASGG
jgi:CDP-4-dehydro-6-deoxyglucose reductase/ferredoxin-NAD(P)+ reductase (naphthalene dioxygenase ferredoxin-specific)